MYDLQMTSEEIYAEIEGLELDAKAAEAEGDHEKLFKIQNEIQQLRHELDIVEGRYDAGFRPTREAAELKRVEMLMRNHKNGIDRAVSLDEARREVIEDYYEREPGIEEGEMEGLSRRAAVEPRSSGSEWAASYEISTNDDRSISYSRDGNELIRDDGKQIRVAHDRDAIRDAVTLLKEQGEREVRIDVVDAEKRLDVMREMHRQGLQMSRLQREGNKDLDNEWHQTLMQTVWEATFADPVADRVVADIERCEARAREHEREPEQEHDNELELE